MALTKLGNYIAIFDQRNTDEKYNEESVVGISTQKKLISTKADLGGLSLSSYKLMPPNSFAYVPDTSRRGEKISLAFNSTTKTFLVSSISIVFIVKKVEELNSDYLYIYFNRPEFDRYARFNSWGSAREAFSWDDMCDIDIEIPPLSIQQKYVDVYKAMMTNLGSYEVGLEDLKLVCDSYIENLRKRIETEPIAGYIQECEERNTDLSVTLAQGIDVNMQFIPAKREAEDKEGTRIVRSGQFAFNKVVKSNGTKLPIALRRGPDCIVSGSYQVFEVNDKNKLLPEYLMLWMSRPETQRLCGFNAWGSTRDVFPYDELCKLKFPIPEISIQEDIVKIYNSYILRKEIIEKLKLQIKDLCPILIKGSIQESVKKWG